MWVSKKKWEQMQKKIADLEGQVQGQQVSDQFVPEDSNGKYFERGVSCEAPLDI